jgi:hypothetical protein
MTRTITAQMTPQGLLIPRAALGDWGLGALEVIQEQHAIIIRPKPVAIDETRDQVRQILEAANLLYQPSWEMPPPVSSEERAKLARKLAQGRPLSEVIIAEREDRI